MIPITKDRIALIKATIQPQSLWAPRLRAATLLQLCDLATEALEGRWQPVETAPKDGTWVQLWRALPAEDGPLFEPMVIARWWTFDDGDQLWAWPDDVFEVWTAHGRRHAEGRIEVGDSFESLGFTHWCPLPSAPAPEPAS